MAQIVSTPQGQLLVPGLGGLVGAMNKHADTCICERCMGDLLGDWDDDKTPVMVHQDSKLELKRDLPPETFEQRLSRAKKKLDTVTMIGKGSTCYFCGREPQVAIPVGKVQGHGGLICATCAVIQLT
jgi:hypothetical protein